MPRRSANREYASIRPCQHLPQAAWKQDDEQDQSRRVHRRPIDFVLPHKLGQRRQHDGGYDSAGNAAKAPDRHHDQKRDQLTQSKPVRRDAAEITSIECAGHPGESRGDHENRNLVPRDVDSEGSGNDFVVPDGGERAANPRSQQAQNGNRRRLR